MRSWVFWFIGLTAITIGLVLFEMHGHTDEYDGDHHAPSAAKRIAIGAIMYSADWDDRLPNATDPHTIQVQLAPYLLPWNGGTTPKDPSNPVDPRLWTSSRDGDLIYNYFLRAFTLTDIDDPAKTTMFYGSHARANRTHLFATADGSVHVVEDSAWRRDFKLNPKTHTYSRPAK